MKRIGLLGGMSWESSAEYYRFVNEAVRGGWVACARPTACCAPSTSRVPRARLSRRAVARAGSGPRVEVARAVESAARPIS